jgi:hypothetical protein
MPLAIEPLHPAHAADRACINTTKQALDICDRLILSAAARSASRSTSITSAGSELPQIARAGKDRLAFHVCDWLVPTRHSQRPRHDGRRRDRLTLRRVVEAQGFSAIAKSRFFNPGGQSR